jgi:hypothetical protein
VGSAWITSSLSRNRNVNLNINLSGPIVLNMTNWTPDEEKAFLQIMSVSSLTRLGAIRLYRRCKANMKRALYFAQEDYPKLSEAGLRALEKARAARRIPHLSVSEPQGEDAAGNLDQPT